MNDFESVFAVELENADSEVVRIQVNSKNSILEQSFELLLFLDNLLIICQVDFVFLQPERHRNLLFRHQDLNLLKNNFPLLIQLLNNEKIIMLFSTSLVDNC